MNECASQGAGDCEIHVVWRDDFLRIKMISHVLWFRIKFFSNMGNVGRLCCKCRALGAVCVGYFLGNASRFFEDAEVAEGCPAREREKERALQETAHLGTQWKFRLRNWRSGCVSAAPYTLATRVITQLGGFSKLSKSAIRVNHECYMHCYSTDVS